MIDDGTAGIVPVKVGDRKRKVQTMIDRGV